MTTEKQLLKQAEKDRKRAEREALKAARDEEKKREKEKRAAEKIKTEADIVRDYANKVIKNAQYHGRVDEKKFKGLGYEKSVNKNLWMDQDFFFSVVFQSGEQKRKFLKLLLENGYIAPEGLIHDESYSIQVINGLEFAQALKIELEPETVKNYPTGNIDLMPFVLDHEPIKDYEK